MSFLDNKSLQNYNIRMIDSNRYMNLKIFLQFMENFKFFIDIVEEDKI